MTEHEYILSLVMSMEHELRQLGCIILVGKGLEYTKDFLERNGTKHKEVHSDITNFATPLIRCWTKLKDVIVVVSSTEDFGVCNFGVLWMASRNKIDLMRTYLI